MCQSPAVFIMSNYELVGTLHKLSGREKLHFIPLSCEKVLPFHVF